MKISMLINGEQAQARNGATFERRNPLDGSVALLKDSYLRVMFPADGAGCSDDATRPRLVTTSACSVCVTWNFYPQDTTDLCAVS